MSPLFDHAQPSAAPVLRTEDDEDADREEYMKNLARQAYKEWPNEAGVSTRFLPYSPNRHKNG